MARSYEEIRSILVDALLLPARERPEQWISLGECAAMLLLRRDGQVGPEPFPRPRLEGVEAELLRDAFWDLFRQGFITLGLNDSNPTWPWFRLSHFGEETLRGEDPYRFTDAQSYLALVRSQVERLDQTTELYLREAVKAYYSGCLLSTAVMLGVATESRFLRLQEAAAASPRFGERFRGVQDERTILAKVTKFLNIVRGMLRDIPSEVREDIETNFGAIQAVIRTSRNEAGHPTGRPADRAQTYVLMQLFVPYAKKLEQLETFFG